MISVIINIFHWRDFVRSKAMKTLVGKKFYKTAEIAQKKLDVFYAASRLTDEEYIELTALVETVYGGEE